MGVGRFITTETWGSGGERGEYRVWERIQDAFREYDCLAYWRYPLFSSRGKRRKEPDILILDRQLGVIIIEVKSLKIDQIVLITGHSWHYQNFYQKEGYPYQQAESQVWGVLDYCDREPALKQKLMARALVALPYITIEQWRSRHFHQLPSAPPILFSHHLNFTAIHQLRDHINHISPLTFAPPLTDNQWQTLLALISGTPLFSPQPSTRWRLSSSSSHGQILQQARQHFSALDLAQEHLAKTIPPGMQRIRGIAGSGKTVILCQKAAHMHIKYPQWKIAIVFFSPSLYQTITEQLDRWLRHFSQAQITPNPRNRNLYIFHGWGSKEQPGFYRFLCRISGISPRRVQDTLSQAPHEALAEACIDLLQQRRIPQVFDAILIDEGQDFLVKDSLKFQDKQPFYWLAYQALRPANSLHPEQKRLIWTVDEYQHLDPGKTASISDLFGQNLGHLLNGEHSGGIPKSKILSKAYRTPAPVIKVAYGLAMGVFHPQGLLTELRHKPDWEALGFSVQGEVLPGEAIALTRPFDQHLNPVTQLWKKPLLQFNTYNSRQQELASLCNHLIQNLRQDGLKPSRDLLVLILGSRRQAHQLESTVVDVLQREGIDVYIPHQQISKSTSFYPFWCEGFVTVSTVQKAKGNEADWVYLIALDHIAEDPCNLAFRNQLFIALTRTRAWVTISGVGNYSLYDEVRQLLDPQNPLKFTLPHSPKRSLYLTEVSEIIARYAAGERNFQNSNLNAAQLPGINFCQGNFIHTQFREANLEKAQLQSTKLIMADLSYANLKGANLRYAKLMGANLAYAQVEGADFTYADLSDANLEGTGLEKFL